MTQNIYFEACASKWVESSYLQHDSGVTVVFKWWSNLWLHVCQLTDAVLTLLEQPLNLLGKVNGFMKPGEGGGDRTRHVCKEEAVEGCLKEMTVPGDEMGEQKAGTLERFVGCLH